MNWRRNLGLNSAGRAVLKAGGARILTMLVGFLATTVSARIVFADAGAVAFGVVMLIATLQTLIPFADLGLGAPVINAVAKTSMLGAAAVKSVLARAFALLSTVALCLSFILTGLFLSGIANSVAEALSVPGSGVFLYIAALTIAWSFPLGLGYRILIGLQRTHVAVLLGLIAPALVLAAVLAVSGTSGPHVGIYLVIWPASTLVLNAIMLLVSLAPLRRALQAPTSNVATRIPLLGSSISMLIIGICMPLMLQSPRVVLAIFGTPEELTTYSVDAQLQAPLIGLIVTLATPLWPQFTQLTENSRSTRRLWMKSLASFAAAGILLCAGFLIVQPLYLSFVSHGAIEQNSLLAGALGALIFLLSVLYPTLMLLNDGSRIRVQALSLFVAAATALPLSIWWTSLFGAAGPPLAALTALTVATILPLTLYAEKSTRLASP